MAGPTAAQQSSQQPLALRRAEHALAAVTLLEAKPTEAGNYVSYVKALPANILRSGLGQAIAMEKAGAAKGKDRGHAKLHDHMEAWLLRGWPTSPYKDKKTLLEAIVKGDRAAYVRAQAEALAYLEWLKKFAVAFLKDPTQDSVDDKKGAGE